MAMTRRALLRALLVAPFTPRAIPTVLADRATGISIRFIKAFDIKVDPRPTRRDLWTTFHAGRISEIEGFTWTPRN